MAKDTWTADPFLQTSHENLLLSTIPTPALSGQRGLSREYAKGYEGKLVFLRILINGEPKVTCARIKKPVNWIYDWPKRVSSTPPACLTHGPKLRVELQGWAGGVNFCLGLFGVPSNRWTCQRPRGGTLGLGLRWNAWVILEECCTVH